MTRIIWLILLLVPCAIFAYCPPGRKTECKVDPCENIDSPYCEPATCGKCRPKCYTEKGGISVPCYSKNCPNKRECYINPCGSVTNKKCKPSCEHCSAVCFGDLDQQVPCDHMTF